MSGGAGQRARDLTRDAAAGEDDSRQGCVDRATRTTPTSLRRALAHLDAYLDAHLDGPVRLADLAAAAGVSQRALNLTFNRHLGTSPIGFLRRARLDAAHHDLQAAGPGDGQSVTSIAARWGFASLPRFGVTYRRAYGRPPSRTLRQDYP